MQHKKRGRPRLREERETRPQFIEIPAPGPSQHPVAAGPTPPTSAAVEPPRHRRAESLRILRSQGAQQSEAMPPEMERQRGAGQAAGYSAPAFPPASFQRPPIPGLAVAFLNLDLRVLKPNRTFDELVAPGSTTQDRNLVDLLDRSHREAIQQLRHNLRDERERREPAYLPPIFTDRDNEAVRSLTEADVERVTRGYLDRTDAWTFVLPNTRRVSYNARIRLSRTSAFFVTLVLLPPERAQTPPPSFSFPGPPPGPSNLPPFAPMGTPREYSMFPPPSRSSTSYSMSAPSSPYSTYQHPGAVPASSVMGPAFPAPSPPSPGYFQVVQPGPSTTLAPMPRPHSVTSEPSWSHSFSQDPAQRDPQSRIPMAPSHRDPLPSAPPPGVVHAQPGTSRPGDPAPREEEEEEEDEGGRPRSRKRRRLGIRDVLE